jgi:CRISPR/Cas system type I-B associated protein Csh2 (Cas7 group RAMP superfamily)
MLVLIKDKIDDYLKEHNDEIVKEAGTRLAEKLVRTKRGKELLEKAAEVSE